MSDNLLTIVAKPHPFDCETVFAETVAGQTIAKVLGANVSLTASVEVGGHPVPRELWHKVRPKPGQTIHVVLYPQGGNGGKWARLVLTVVLMYFTYGQYGWAAGASSAFGGTAAVWGAGIMLVGTLAINALVPPPSPKGLGGSGNPFQQLNSLTGTSNQANPYGVIPCVVGTMRYFPPHAALPYTEISGDDQYLRMMLDLGYGDLDISDIQIGDTPIDSYDDVEYEISATPTLFSQDIYEEQLSIAMDNDTAYTRTTQENCSEISIDLVFPQGLFGVNDKGDFVRAWQFVVIEFAVTGTDTWYGVTAPTAGITLSSNAIQESAQAQYKITSSANKMLRVGVRWKVPGSHQWDVRLTSGHPGWDKSVQQSTAMAWTALRSVSPQNPSTTGTTKLAVRIKATDQLNGIVSNLSVLSSQKLRMWDADTSTFLDPVATQNPAWIYLWLLTQCPAVLRRLDDSKVDINGIAAWAAECETKGYKIGFVMDSGRALFDVLSDVLAAGRASFGLRNSLYSCVRDIAQSVPVQMFTPSNSWGFSYSRSFAKLPHALRVTFTNPEANYQQDTVTVYADGYTESNATIFETLDLSMVTDPAAAWRLGRYHLSVIYYRPNQYTFQADIEHMVCERGDLIMVAHDVTGWGEAWGRITAVSGKNVTLDGTVTLASGSSYMIRVRRPDGTQVTETVTSSAGTLQTLALSTALASSDVGNLYVLGIVNRGVAPLIVRKIEPGDDLTATITAVDASPAVWTADAGTPPTFVSSITGTSWCAAPNPPVVDIYAADSAPNDAGVIQAAAGVGASGGGSAGILRPVLGSNPNAPLSFNASRANMEIN